MESSEITSALHTAQAEYRRNLPNRIGELGARWQSVCASGWDSAEFKAFIRLAHRLAGSGETYGYAEVSRSARALELYAIGLAEKKSVSKKERAHVELLLTELANAARMPPEPPA